jgi:hypothetical protein
MKTYNAGNLPAAVYMVPYNNKPAGAGGRIGFGAVMEFVKPDLYRSVIGYRIYLYATGYQLTGYFPADVFAGGFYHIFFRGREAALVMVKLEAVGIKSGVGIQVNATGIISAKEKAVLVKDGVIQGLVVRLKLGCSFLNSGACQEYRYR